MSTSAKMNTPATITAATPKQTVDDELHREGGDIQSRGSGNHIMTKEDNDDEDRDGGDIQSRGPDTSTKYDKKKTPASNSSPDDVERGG